MKLPTFPRVLLKGIFRCVLVFVFLLLPLAVFALNHWGMPPYLTHSLTEALSGEQYRITVEKMKLHPLRGLVAINASIWSERNQPLAQVDRITLALNLSALMRREIQVETLELNRANLTIPLADGAGLQLHAINARLLLPPGQLRLAHGSFHLSGVDVELTGTLLNPDKFAAGELGTAGTSEEEVMRWLHRIIERAREIEHLEPARLQVAFSGDLSDMQTIAADTIKLTGGPLRWKKVQIESLVGFASYASGRLHVKNLDIKEFGGSLHLTGEINDREQKAELLLHSSLQVRPWIHSFGQESWIADMAWSKAPEWEVFAQFFWMEEQTEARISGRLLMEEFAFREVPVSHFLMDFAWRPGLFLTRGAKVRGPGMDGVLDAKLEGKVMTVRVEGSVDPVLCMNWLDEGLKKTVSLMEFAEPARGQMALVVPLENSAGVKGSGEVSLGKTAMRGAWIDSATADVTIADRAATYENLVVQMDGGRATGTFVYDFGNREVRFSNVQSTLPPAKFMLWVDPRISETISNFRFNSPPTVTASGVIDMADPSGNRAEISVFSQKGLKYDLLGQTLPIDSARGNLVLKGHQLKATVREASLFGGGTQLQADIKLGPDNPSYTLDAKVDKIDFASLNKLYFDYEDSTGWLTGSIRYSAEFQNQSLLKGSGSVKVEDGNVFAIPILGPFSGILNSIIPGVGYQNSRLATTDFTIANQVIHTPNLEIYGNGFSLFGEGDIRFVADELDMNVRINAKGVPGLVLFPVSKLLEYSSSGSVSDPVWRPRNVPREVYGEGLIETITAPLRELITGEKADEKEKENTLEGNSGRPQILRRVR